MNSENRVFRARQIELLLEKLNEDWGFSSAIVHSSIADIRSLLRLLEGEFMKIDGIAVEIETLSGEALGFEEDTLDARALDLVNLYKAEISRVVMQLKELE